MRWAEGAAIGSRPREAERFAARAFNKTDAYCAIGARRFRIGLAGWIEPATGPSNFFSHKLLVTLGRAFYNPPNTALDIVGMSIRRNCNNHQPRTDSDSASECLSKDSTSASPRSTE